jgi:hypothetical protein
MCVIRDVYQPLGRYEEFMDELFVGCVGAGGMTAGVIFKDKKRGLYMFQCEHGYEHIGMLSLPI